MYSSRAQPYAQSPPGQYAAGQTVIPQRATSNRFPPQPVAPPPQPKYAQQSRALSPPYQQVPPPRQPAPREIRQQGYLRPSQPMQHLPMTDEPMRYDHEPPEHYQSQGSLYQEEMAHMDPLSDLPPHFEMEREDWSQDYPPEVYVSPGVSSPDRQLQQTPEPVTQPQFSINEVSPPRPWERALTGPAQAQAPQHSNSVSSYDPPANALGGSPISPERQRSIAPQVTRQTIPSPKKDSVAERAMSYPSRKPPSSLKFHMEPDTQLSPEEDYRLRRQGFPIVAFGFGGRMITMIPRTPHRVNLHGMAPAPIPGPITFSSLKGVADPPGMASSFPGPLFVSNKPVKGKAKEIVNWLEENISMLDHLRETKAMPEADIIHNEDRKVLCKLLKLLVENNGILDGGL
jgi:hypothetical protein